MKYREAYEIGRQALEMQTIGNAAFDARSLLEFVCNTNHNDLFIHGDRELTEEEQSSFSAMLDKRKERIPLQHIIGTQEFMGLLFEVSKDVLIPRQDTEVLVEECMKYLDDEMNFLDMCTGSGCILISLLHYGNNCVGTGVDVSDKALDVARKNAMNNHLEACFVQSDLFEGVEGKFDFIVSNPPYIRSDVIPTLMMEVKEFEPMLALDGKEDGLFFYRRIIRDAKKHLVHGGKLFFEIGHDQREDVINCMKSEGYAEINCRQDYAGLDRVVSGTFLEEIYV